MAAFRPLPLSALKIWAARHLLGWRVAQRAWGLHRWLGLQRRKWRLSLPAAAPSFRLSRWYGRTGNNIQQLIVVIAHAEAFRGSVQVDEDFIQSGPLRNIVNAFSLDFQVDSAAAARTHLSGLFFHYMEYGFSRSDHRRMAFANGDKPRRDSVLGRQYIRRQAHRIARAHLAPHILRPPPGTFSEAQLESTLVIHLRGGDVANLTNPYYITNPLHFYRELRQRHRRAIIVTEPGSSHPLLEAVLSLFADHDVVTGSVEDDFQLLRHATHLATSGVGTFAVAAALLSERLRRFHCTDVFLNEHLNPHMLDADRVTVEMLRLPGYVKAWRRSSDRLKLLHHWRPPTAAGAAPGISAVPGAGDPP
ncbi:hypothetical protein [Cyanobium sp. Lug-B]|uniref:hypothetical protein n=1 Tax=Cyanobium sp. Lug-B TaxID=2823716 RepID=UPI0020CE9723|nr:hypothetical protein [Cyanobium sp. Lug-B]MCP9796545.1 hypothetical protein [Cyanobium sp. Lug-B]